MSQYGFSTEENGYSIPEVDTYIQRLREEYQNAVEWGKEKEKNAKDNYDPSALSAENEKLKKENERLNSDCRILAAKLRELLANNANIENAKEAAASVVAGAQEQAARAVRSAEEKAASILRTAEKECQSIIHDATQRIEELKAELHSLEEEKAAAEAEIRNMTAFRDDIRNRLDRVKELLDI
ncbi:MAG: DivIVA domain-containing protein [Acutalibacteraceae bacterium]